MTSETSSRDSQIVDTASAIVDGLDEKTLGAEQMLLGATKLARLVGDRDMTDYFAYELAGYENVLHANHRFLEFSGRTSEKGKPVVLPLPTIELIVRKADSLGETARERTMEIFYEKLKYDLILRNVRMRAYFFAFQHLQSRLAGEDARDCFDVFQQAVTLALSSKCNTMLEKVPILHRQLGSEDDGARRQAIGSCRRLLMAFGEFVSEQTAEAAGQAARMPPGPERTLALIGAWIEALCMSEPRRRRLKQTAAMLLEATAEAAQEDLGPPSEVNALAVQTYVLVGEMLLLKQDYRETASRGKAKQPN